MARIDFVPSGAVRSFLTSMMIDRTPSPIDRHGRQEVFEKGTTMPGQFNHLEGAREFALDDRRKVKEVLDDVLDEMGDSHELNNMFAPYAEVVHFILTDTRIKQNIAAIGAIRSVVADKQHIASDRTHP